MQTRGKGRAWMLLVVGAVLLSAATAHAGWARFALVIGYNDSDDENLAPLRYADDDAVKHAELLGVMTERTVLLTQLDEDTQRLFQSRMKGVRAPTRDNIKAALRSLRIDMAQAAARGDKPVLYFVYSGHGNYDQEGRGYVHVDGGRFTTRDIYYDVLGPTEGSNPHHVVLMVDACNAALLVNSRGGDRRKARKTSLRLEDYPNVGVILSASSVGEVHEWGKLLSGIFSHELRSAFVGPADLNNDDMVSFPELAAFIHLANAEIKNETYRLKPYIRPPLSAPNMPLVDLKRAQFKTRVMLPKNFVGKAHLVDSEQLRVADFHKGSGHEYMLGLPSDGGYVLVHGKKEHVIPAGKRGVLQLGELEVRNQSVLAGRGPGEYFEKRLFARAQAPAAGVEWIEQQYERSLLVERYELVPWYKNAGAWSLLSTGVVGLSAGVAFHVTGLNQAGKGDGAFWVDVKQAHYDAASQNETMATVMYSVGAAAAVGSVLWFILDRDYETTQYRPPIKVNVTPGGILLRTDF